MPDGESFRPRLHLALVGPGETPPPASADDATRLLRRLDPQTRREFGLEDDEPRSFEASPRADEPPTIDLVAEVVAISAR
jgi:hypothetical protein